MAQEDPRQRREEALLALMNQTGYNIIQENGQRKYGGPPPGWEGPPPPKGCEIFVGKIPRDLFEDELVPVFERIGPIYEIRLMMDFSGSNRGYGFVMYTCAEHAHRAIQELNNYEIRRHRFLGVVKSVDNCRLFVGGIPKNKTSEEILEEMQKVTEGVVDVILYSSISDKNRNRGFAFVEYESHRAAAMARRKLIPGKILLWGHEVAVDWAEPEPDVDDVTMSKVMVLYVRNLLLTTTEEVLRAVFNEASGNGVEKVKKLRDFAFVHFFSRAQAQAAKEAINGTEIDGSVVDVTWAKPVDKKQYKLQKQLAKEAAFEGSAVLAGPSVVSVPSPSPLYPLDGSLDYSYRVVSPSVLIRGIRGRARGAAGIRGRSFSSLSRGNLRRAPEIRRYNVNPALVNLMGVPLALNPVLNPYVYGIRCPSQLVPSLANKHAPEALADICRRFGYAEPEYELLSNVAHPPNEHEEGRLYVYKITIRGQGSTQPLIFQPRAMASTPSEAKLIAAEYAMTALGFSSEASIGSDTSFATSPRPSPPMSGAGSDDVAHSVAHHPLARSLPVPSGIGNVPSPPASHDFYAMANQFAQLSLGHPMFIEPRIMEHGFYDSPTMGLAGLPANRLY